MKKTVIRVLISVFVILAPVYVFFEVHEMVLKRDISKAHNDVSYSVKPSPEYRRPTDTPTIIPTKANTDIPLGAFICKYNRPFFLPIFMYHHVRPITKEMTSSDKTLSVDPSLFEAQLSELQKAGYQTLFMSDVVKIMMGQEEVPQKAVVLTFDDGYDNFSKYALPLLQKYHAKGTIYVITNYIGSVKPNLAYMTYDDISNALSSGNVELGSHTMTHPSLSKQSETKLFKELHQSKAILEKDFSKQVLTIAYPSGDYNQHVINKTQSYGYYAAVTTKMGVYQSCATRFEMPRIRPNTFYQEIYITKLEALRTLKK